MTDDKKVKAACQQCGEVTLIPAGHRLNVCSHCGAAQKQEPVSIPAPPPVQAVNIGMLYCRACGKQMHVSALFCPGCGATQTSAPTLGTSAKTMLPATILCVFLGWAGAHRMYVGKAGTGILMLLTGGGFVIFWVLDLVNIVSGNFTDSAGAKIDRWTNASPVHYSPNATRGTLPPQKRSAFSVILIGVVAIMLLGLLARNVAPWIARDRARAPALSAAATTTAASYNVANSITQFCSVAEKATNAVRCKSDFSEKQVTIVANISDTQQACEGMASRMSAALSANGRPSLSGWRLLIASPQGSAACRF